MIHGIRLIYICQDLFNGNTVIQISFPAQSTGDVRINGAPVETRELITFTRQIIIIGYCYKMKCTTAEIIMSILIYCTMIGNECI